MMSRGEARRWTRVLAGAAGAIALVVAVVWGHAGAGAGRRTALQAPAPATAGAYATWLKQDSAPMRPSGVQPGSGRDGMSRDSIEGDSFIDKGWKSMWKAIPAGYSAVTKELKGYMVDGKAQKGNKSEKKARSELASYSSILGDVSAWPKATPEAQKLGREGKKYDKELESYDDILSFPTAHPMHQKLPMTDTRSKDQKVEDEIKRAKAQLHDVDAKLHAINGDDHGGKGSDADRDRCEECKQKWSAGAMECAQSACERKLWQTPLEQQQVSLNNKLAGILQGCLPEQEGYHAKVLVPSFVLPWNQPFSQPAHSWVRAVAAPQADLGLGLLDGETTKLKLAGDEFFRFAKRAPQKSPTKEPHKRAPQKSPTKEPHKRAPQKSPTKEPFNTQKSHMRRCGAQVGQTRYQAQMSPLIRKRDRLTLASRSGAALKCTDGRSLNDHVADLAAPQTQLNREKARTYFATLSNTREGARHMADKALESQAAGAAVLSWVFPGGHRRALDLEQSSSQVCQRNPEL